MGTRTSRPGFRLQVTYVGHHHPAAPGASRVGERPAAEGAALDGSLRGGRTPDHDQLIADVARFLRSRPRPRPAHLRHPVADAAARGLLIARECPPADDGERGAPTER